MKLEEMFQARHTTPFVLTRERLRAALEDPQESEATREEVRQFLNCLDHYEVREGEQVLHEDSDTIYAKSLVARSYGIDQDHELAPYVDWEGFAQAVLDGVDDFYYNPDDHTGVLFYGFWYCLPS